MHSYLHGAFVCMYRLHSLLTDGVYVCHYKYNHNDLSEPLRIYVCTYCMYVCSLPHGLRYGAMSFEYLFCRIHRGDALVSGVASGGRGPR